MKIWQPGDPPSRKATACQAKSTCKPCSKLSLNFFVRDAFPTVELVHPFLDCRKKLNSLSDFIERNFIGQLADRIQSNFFLRHVINMCGPRAKANWKIAATAVAIYERRIASMVGDFARESR